MSKVQFVKMDKGPWVISEEVPGVKTVRCSVFIRTGSIFENKKNNGISHFIEHGLFKGTLRRKSKDISLEIESKGGSINAYTSSEHTSVYVHILPEDLDSAIDLLSDILFGSQFEKNVMEKERFVILEEVKGYFDSPEHVLLQRTYERIFGKDSPLALPIEGTKESVKRISIEELKSYWKRYYYPENVIVSVAGNINHKEVFSTIRKHFPEGSNRKPSLIGESSKQTSVNKKAIFHKRGLKHEYVTIATRTFSYTDNRKYPFMILNAYLGGGMSSYLFQKFREENPLVYTITTFSNLYKNTGEWGIFFATDKRNLQKVLDLIRDDFSKIELKDSDVECVKKKLKGAYSIELDRLGSKVSRNFRELFYYEKYRSPEKVLNNILSVKTEDVNEMARSILNTEKLILTVLGGVKNVDW